MSNAVDPSDSLYPIAVLMYVGVGFGCVHCDEGLFKSCVNWAGGSCDCVGLILVKAYFVIVMWVPV